jgi:hypothetical protein
VGDLPVQEVLYDKQLRYLIIVLREGEGIDGGAATRQALLDLKPNNQQLGDAHTGGQLVGVIATAQGGCACVCGLEGMARVDSLLVSRSHHRLLPVSRMQHNLTCSPLPPSKRL